MTSNAPVNTVNSAIEPTSSSWHVGQTPVFPSSLLLSDNAAIESLLSDIPFLAVGLLAFAVLTFLLIVRKFDSKSIPLFLSPVLAFVAVLLDINQLLVQHLPGTASASESFEASISNDGLTVPLSSVLPLLVAREVFLALSFGMRFLYFWIYLHCVPKRMGANANDKIHTVPMRTTPGLREPNFLKLKDSLPLDSFRTSFNNSNLFPFILVIVSKYAILLMTFSIPILQLLWRLVRKFNRRGEVYVADSLIEIITSALVITALLAGILVDNVDMGRATRFGNRRILLNHFALSWRKVNKWEKFRRHIPVLFSVIVGLGLGIGNLLCFEFSESSLGRLFQALELYILILYVLVSTFYEKRQVGRSSAESADVEGRNNDQIADVMEKTPASGLGFRIQSGTSGSLLPTSASPLPQKSSRYSSPGSWPLSIHTNRDNETDDNIGMLSMPGSSTLPPSIETKGGLSSWLSGRRRSVRSIKLRSGLLGGAGGRIRSISWSILNDTMEVGQLETGGSKKAGVLDSVISSNQGPPDQRQMQPENSLQIPSESRPPIARARTPPLASRLERLAMQLASSLSTPGHGETVDNVTAPSSADRTSKASTSYAFEPRAMLDSNEFRLTPVTPGTPELRQSSYYNPDLEPTSYSPQFSYLYTKSVRSSISTAEIESFLRQQQAELDKSVAELRLFEEGDVGGLDVDKTTRIDSTTSDFSVSKFPEPPRGMGRLSNTFDGVRVSPSRASRTSLGDHTLTAYQKGLSFPSPVQRASGDSSVLGVNEAALTLGLGSGIDFANGFTRGELGTRQLDVTSFIATGAGGGGIDSFGPPAKTSTFSAPTLSGTEDVDGVDTPPPSTVRFATKVHVLPVTSVSATVTRSLSGSRNGDASDTVNGTQVPTKTAQLPGQARIPNNRPLRKKTGIGLPSSVKLSRSNPVRSPSADNSTIG